MSITNKERAFIPVRIAVLTVSDSRTLADDKSGQILADRIVAAGHELKDRAIVSDDVERIRAQVLAWVERPTSMR
jgi:molybdopterin adenylyltransferase